MTLNCGCIEDDERQKTWFCRGCAFALPQRIEDDRGRLISNPDWLQARCAFATGSHAKDIVARKQNNEPTAKYDQYMDQLVAERLTGRPQVGKEVHSLIDRAQAEPEGRAAYAFFQNCEVVEVGFVHHLFIERFGISPDGYVGDDGMVEFKKLNAAQHVKLWEGGPKAETILDEYRPQCYSGLACSSRNWCDLVSYHPSMLDEELKLFVHRIWRDEAKISALECAVRDFLAEVDRRVEAIRNRDSNGHSSELTAQLAGSLAMLKPDSKVVPIKRKRK